MSSEMVFEVASCAVEQDTHTTSPKNKIEMGRPFMLGRLVVHRFDNTLGRP